MRIPEHRAQEVIARHIQQFALATCECRTDKTLEEKANYRAVAKALENVYRLLWEDKPPTLEEVLEIERQSHEKELRGE